MGLAAANAQESAPGQGNEAPKQAADAVAQGATQNNPAEQPAIQVENWSRPQSGWLYVLDPKPCDAAGRIWLIDSQTGKVMGSIRTSASPDFALSPDGSRLYVASSTGNDSNELAVIDTTQGVILTSGAVAGGAGYDELPPFSTMAVSGDGLALRMLIDAPKSEDKDAFLLATFDTRAGEFLPGIVRLGNCGPGRFISYPAADHFDFLCPRTNRVRLIRVDADSREVQNHDVELPWERRIGVAEAFESPDSTAMAIVRGDGAVVGMNLATQQFVETPVHPGLPNRVPPAAWPTSPDGRRVYLGYNRDYDKADNRFYLDYGRPPNSRPAAALAGEFSVYDTNTWAKVATIRTKMLFWNAVVSTDGNWLYATAPQKHSMLVIDTAKRHQAGVLKVGGAPALVLVAP
jgi:DNA-binding beta-propeller fold protein YncE